MEEAKVETTEEGQSAEPPVTASSSSAQGEMEARAAEDANSQYPPTFHLDDDENNNSDDDEVKIRGENSPSANDDNSSEGRDGDNVDNQNLKVEGSSPVSAGSPRMGRWSSNLRSPQSLSEEERRNSTFSEIDGQFQWSNDSNSEGSLSIWTGTWNLANSPPPNSIGLSPFLNPEDKYDICAITTQETSYEARADYKTKSVLGSVHEKIGHYIDFGQDWPKHPNVADWIQTLRAHMGMNYYLVEETSLWAIRILVFALKKHRENITDICKSAVACGIANMLGNKGAVAVSFRYKQTSMCFLSAHLAAHQDMTKRRNEDYKEIVQGMQIGNKEMDFLTQFHHVFWLGDLNYRLDFGTQGEDRSPEEKQFNQMVGMVMERNFKDLLKEDQLRKEMFNSRAFLNFQEGDINFPPTFKVIADQVLEYNPKRSPAWCDRILWNSLKGISVSQEQYKSALAVLSSDHKPVYAIFKVPFIDLTPNPYGHPWMHNYGIRFRNLRARGLVPWDAATNSCDPYLKIVQSNFVEEQCQTVYVPGSINPSWPQGLFVRLSDEVQCNKTLGNAFLMVVVMDHDLIPPHTLLGRAVIPLSVLGPLYLSEPLVPLDKTEPVLSEFVDFEAQVTLNGENRGRISGELRVEGILRQDPPPGVSKRLKSQPTKAESVVNFGFNMGLAALSKAKKVPGTVSGLFGKKSR